jgi:enamine deaminase RidA (YjgF/YER057c/UK114 family)
MSENITIVEVPGWPRPKGYANGVIGHGRTLHVAGQIGVDSDGLIGESLVEQFAMALDNLLAVVAAAGGQPTDIASMTVYVTDVEAYRNSASGLGAVWRERLGKHFPAMALVGAAALYEHNALVEIQAVAHLA